MRTLGGRLESTLEDRKRREGQKKRTHAVSPAAVVVAAAVPPPLPDPVIDTESAVDIESPPCVVVDPFGSVTVVSNKVESGQKVMVQSGRDSQVKRAVPEDSS